MFHILQICKVTNHDIDTVTLVICNAFVRKGRSQNVFLIIKKVFRGVNITLTQQPITKLYILSFSCMDDWMDQVIIIGCLAKNTIKLPKSPFSENQYKRR